jgi:hypothetical protein
MSIINIVAPIWNEIAKMGLRSQWARERFNLEDSEQLLQAYNKEAKQLEKKGIPNPVLMAFLDAKPLLLERDAIVRYKEQSSGWMDHALPEVNSINEAVILLTPDYMLNRSQQQQLTKLLKEMMQQQMKSEKSLTSSPQHSLQQKPGMSSASEMLTPYELEQLRQDQKEADDYARKAFSHLRQPR